jgi:hypothetical protein
MTPEPLLPKAAAAGPTPVASVGPISTSTPSVRTKDCLLHITLPFGGIFVTSCENARTRSPIWRGCGNCFT